MKARIEDNVVYSPYPNIEIPVCSFYTLAKERFLTESDKVALVGDGKSLTRAEVLARMERYAVGLQQHGVLPGDRICIHLNNKVDNLLVMYGCTLAGATVVLAKTSLTEGELRYQAEDSDCTHIITEEQYADKARAAVSNMKMKVAISAGTIRPPTLPCDRRQASSAAKPYLRRGRKDVVVARSGGHSAESCPAGSGTGMATIATATPNDAPACIGRNDQPAMVRATTQATTTGNHATTEAAILSAQLVSNEEIATDLAKGQSTEADDNISEATESCLDEDLRDAHPFITVNYKKQQSQGIPVSFSHRNVVLACKPECIGNRGISRDKGKKLLDVRITRDGSILALAAALEGANRLLVTTTSMGMSVEPKVPASYSRNVGGIKNIPLEHSDAELLDYLKDMGVISVRRRSSRRQNENGEV
ncbi:hypothetical protein HPB50_022151 [Hyalomma asiaticum]|uniref:Uncharacterized protein n=1 Tax=Hyalomma asiaticum TaxID=266040 RepID=A0ACB7SVW2_HYAAI|nr:hypothetical protein HPB50_022151 [Hyalomma asiaticum]